MLQTIKKFYKYYKTKLSIREFYELEAELPSFIKNYSLFFSKDKLNKIESLIQTPISSLILDIGCGTGYFTKRLREKGYKVIGTDISRNRIKEAGPDNFIVSDAKNLPFKKESFDCIIASDVIEHLPGSLIQNIRLILSLLKKNGQIIISVPYGFANNDKGHIHKLSIPEWEAIFNKLGFKIKDKLASKLSIFNIKTILTMNYIYSFNKDS